MQCALRMTRSPLLKLPRYTDRELWRTLKLGEDERHPFTLGKNIASKKGNADNPFDYFQLNMTPQTIIVALITTATTPNPRGATDRGPRPPAQSRMSVFFFSVGVHLFRHTVTWTRQYLKPWRCLSAIK